VHSFVPEQGAHWMWPNQGVRLGDKLLLFYGRVFQQTPGSSGFRYDGWTAFVVDDPDDEPSAWRLTEARVPPDEHDVQLGHGWRLGGAARALGAIYGEAIGPHDDTAKHLGLGRGELGVAFSARAFDVTPFVATEIGHGPGLLVNRDEWRGIVGVKLYAR